MGVKEQAPGSENVLSQFVLYSTLLLYPQDVQSSRLLRVGIVATIRVSPETIFSWKHPCHIFVILNTAVIMALR